MTPNNLPPLTEDMLNNALKEVYESYAQTMTGTVSETHTTGHTTTTYDDPLHPWGETTTLIPYEELEVDDLKDLFCTTRGELMQHRDLWAKCLSPELLKNIEDYIQLGNRIRREVDKAVRASMSGSITLGPDDYRDKHHDTCYTTKGDTLPF